MSLIDPQPEPVKLASDINLWEMVISDMKERDQFGQKKYGTALHPFNERDKRYA